MSNTSDQAKNPQSKLSHDLGRNLEALVEMPREDLAIEYKSWLNLDDKANQATLVKAVIAMANHGGGYVVLGFKENANNKTPESVLKPAEYPEVTQDRINSVIQKFATAAPDFHCKVDFVSHPQTGANHAIISVPGNQKEPVMSKRDGEDLVKHRCYIRKPGARSEEPKTSEEWRTLFNRCVRNSREDLLDAIRVIVSGEATSTQTKPDVQEDLKNFCHSAFSRWRELIKGLPEQAPQRCPHGFYEMGFALQGANSLDSLEALNQRLAMARQIKMTGWSPFLELYAPQRAPYPYDKGTEAWTGRPVGNGSAQSPARSTFWRASRDGKLYTLTGYGEDHWENLGAYIPKYLRTRRQVQLAFSTQDSS